MLREDEADQIRRPKGSIMVLDSIPRRHQEEDEADQLRRHKKMLDIRPMLAEITFLYRSYILLRSGNDTVRNSHRSTRRGL
jgi:hypothetical protein